MARFMNGGSMVRTKTLLKWDALFDKAFDLLCDSPISDLGIADDTADIAHTYVRRELNALGAFEHDDDDITA